MAEIINVEEAKSAAAGIVDSAIQQSNDSKAVFQQLMDELAHADVSEGGFEELAVLLAMPEEQFALLAPSFLDSLQRSFYNINDELTIAQALNAAGLKCEDVREEFTQICGAIDEKLAGYLSTQKIDFLKKLLGMVYNAAAETEGIAKKTVIIPIEFCHEDAKMPAYAHLSDSGMDVYALEDITIAPGETKLIPLGIKVAIPSGYELQVRPKSGRSLKSKLRIANTPGTIDSGYRDEIGVIVDNIDPPIRAIHFDDNNLVVLGGIEFGQSYTIGKGEKFAQLVLSEVPKAVFTQVSKVDEIGENRGGGFGSTGVK